MGSTSAIAARVMSNKSWFDQFRQLAAAVRALCETGVCFPEALNTAAPSRQ
jgi:hypothetical protein